ncbi:Repressor ROX1 [Mycena sanguinolenta]|uniref:Repressor ROX1 n=1 Tax=Mycena sanguinolenta TaxID=230812 RepID=A0A8H6YI49_9AGAR|nr:Repressor ROX1 [Mycena sanguinolenta]
MPALRTRATHPAARSIGIAIKNAPLPGLEIIAPTPRTGTFPPTHSLSDNDPYCSPSHSPLESSMPSPSTPLSSPDGQRHFSAPPLPAFTRTVFPISEPQSPSPVRPALRQNSSSGGTPTEERRPKKGDEDYVKRPENSFILFRRHCSQDIAAASASPSNAPSPAASSSSAPSPPAASTPPPGKKYRQADLSRIISQRWKALTSEERAYWEELAQEKKREHEAKHPNYVYRPRRPKKAGSSPAPAEPEPTAFSQPPAATIAPPPSQAQVIEFVVPPAKAETLPPHQTLQVPTLENQPASAVPADSTNLMQMILQLQRGLQSYQHQYQYAGGFDYVPNANLEVNLEAHTLLSPPVDDTARSPASASSSSPDSSPSPYTPCAAFPPAVFTSASSASPSAFADVASFVGGDAQLPDSGKGEGEDGMGLGLYDPFYSSAPEFNSAPAADSWFGSSPWPSTSAPSLGQADNFDFDLSLVPGAELVFPGGESGFVLPGGCAEFGFPLAFDSGVGAFDARPSASGSALGAAGEQNMDMDTTMAVDGSEQSRDFGRSAFSFEA